MWGSVSRMNQISIKTDDGACPAYEFGSGPSVLFFIDGIGMRPAMHELGERLGAAGYRVLMPDLFYRMGPYTAPDPTKLFTDPAVGADWFKRAFVHASADKCMSDCKAFLAHLPGKVGTTGYCMGGRMSITAAGTYPDRIVAAAAYHPGGLATDDPTSPHLLASKIKAKLFIGAAHQDKNFDDAQQQRLAKALDDAHVDYKLEVFTAMHGWVPSDTPVHDDAQAERHWTTLLDLLGKTLQVSVVERVVVQLVDDVDRELAAQADELARRRVRHDRARQRGRAAIHRAVVLQHECAALAGERAGDALDAHVAGRIRDRTARRDHLAGARRDELARELLGEVHAAERDAVIGRVRRLRRHLDLERALGLHARTLVDTKQPRDADRAEHVGRVIVQCDAGVELDRPARGHREPEARARRTIRASVIPRRVAAGEPEPIAPADAQIGARSTTSRSTSSGDSRGSNASCGPTST